MVQINFAQKQVNAKIVYYGPGMSGKTTNLEVVHQRAPTPNRGDLTSISTDGDRTLFFDFMPLDLGTVAGMRTCFQIYTVPGQVYYNSTRKLVLQGVDGVVFVADSSASMVQENLESLKNLEQNLNEYGKTLASLPHIIQFNKRDLPDAMSVEELQKLLNVHNAPAFEAIANTGQGVFPTLKALAARVLETIHTGTRGAPSQQPAPMPAAPSAAPTGQTTFTQRQAQQAGGGQKPAIVPGAPAHAPGAGASPPKPPMPSPTPQRAPMPVAADANARTAFNPPTPQSIPMGGGGHGQASPMQSIPMPAPGTTSGGGQPPRAPQFVHGRGVPQAPTNQPGFGGNPGAGGQPARPAPAGAAGSLQMMRTEPMAQNPPLTSTAYNRTRPATPARPAAKPTGPQAPRVAASSTQVETGKKKSVTSLMLVVAALVAGAVIAFAVLS